MSRRDVAAALGVSRREIQRWLDIASIPDAEFEAAIERDKPADLPELQFLGRRRAGKPATFREHRCPQCGYVLRIEDAG